MKLRYFLFVPIFLGVISLESCGVVSDIFGVRSFFWTKKLYSHVPKVEDQSESKKTSIDSLSFKANDLIITTNKATEYFNKNIKEASQIIKHHNPLVTRSCKNPLLFIDSIAAGWERDKTQLSRFSDSIQSMLYSLQVIDDELLSNEPLLADVEKLIQQQTKISHKDYARKREALDSLANLINEIQLREYNQLLNGFDVKIEAILKRNKRSYLVLQVYKSNYTELKFNALDYWDLPFYFELGEYHKNQAQFDEDRLRNYCVKYSKLLEKFQNDTTYRDLNFKILLLVFGYVDQEPPKQSLMRELSAIKADAIYCNDWDADCYNLKLSQIRADTILDIVKNQLDGVVSENIVVGACSDGLGIKYPYKVINKEYYSFRDKKRRFVKIYCHIIAY